MSQNLDYADLVLPVGVGIIRPSIIENPW